MLVDASQRHGYLDKMESTLLDNVFEFSDRKAGEELCVLCALCGCFVFYGFS